MSKEITGIVLDARIANKDSNFFDYLTSCAKRILHRAAIEARKSDMCGVVVVGSAESKNHLDLANVLLLGQFKSSFEYLAAWQARLDQIKNECQESGDLLDGVIVCGDAMIEAMGNGKYSAATLYVLSTPENIASIDDEDGIKEVRERLEEDGIDTVFLLPSDQSSVPFGDLITDREFEEEFKYPIKRTRPATIFKGELRIGEKLRIKVKMFSKTHPTPLPRGKWTTDSSASESKSTGHYQRGKMTDAEAVPDERLVKAYKYGKDRVPFAAVDEAEASGNKEQWGGRSLDILGFGPKDQLEHASFLSVVYVLYPDAEFESGFPLFIAIVRAMIEKERVGIARWIRNDRSDPKLLYLIPFEIGMYAVIAPFTEDHRPWTFPSLPQLSNDVMDKYVDTFTDDACILPANPTIQRLQMAIQQRATGGASAEIPAVAGDLAHHLTPLLSSTDARCTSLAQSLQDQLPLKLSETSSWHRTTALDVLPRFWIESKLGADHDTNDPLPRFNHILQDTTQDRVPEALLFLMSRIPLIVGEGDIELAGRCLSRLREAVVCESHSVRFNAFITELRRRAREGSNEHINRVWREQVVPRRITLISNAEDTDSPVTPEEADDFMRL